jgi:hypothetical protein
VNREARRLISRRDATAFSQSERSQVWHPQYAMSYAGAISITGGATLCDVTERIGAFIAKALCVRCTPDTQRVEDDDESAAHATATLSCNDSATVAGA